MFPPLFLWGRNPAPRGRVTHPTERLQLFGRIPLYYGPNRLSKVIVSEITEASRSRQKIRNYLFDFLCTLCFHKSQAQFFRSVPASDVRLVVFFHYRKVFCVTQKLFEELCVFKYNCKFLTHNILTF